MSDGFIDSVYREQLEFLETEDLLDPVDQELVCVIFSVDDIKFVFERVWTVTMANQELLDPKDLRSNKDISSQRSN